jgi:hypothetical protein
MHQRRSTQELIFPITVTYRKTLSLHRLRRDFQPGNESGADGIEAAQLEVKLLSIKLRQLWR